MAATILTIIVCAAEGTTPNGVSVVEGKAGTGSRSKTTTSSTDKIDWEVWTE